MKTALKYGLCVLLLLCSTSYAITKNDLANAIKAMENAMVDISVTYTWYVDPPPTEKDVAGTSDLFAIGKPESTFSTARPFSERILSSESVQVENEHGLNFHSDMKLSYNGTIGKIFSTSDQSDVIPSGTITKRKDFLPSITVTPLAFSILRFYPESIAEYCMRDSSRLLDNIQTINDFNSVCLELVAVVNGQEILYRRIYFSIDHGYAPVRFESISRSGEITFTADMLAFTKTSNGLWFPIKGKVKFNNDDHISIYEANEVILNQGLTEKDFDIQFTPGTRIMDEIIDISYFYRSTEEQFDKWLKDQHIIAQHETKPASISTPNLKIQSNPSSEPNQPVKTSTPPNETQVDRFSNYVPFALIIALIAIIGLTAVYYVRRRQK